MNTEEYGRMFAVEDTHWWYRALHAHVHAALRGQGTTVRRIADIGCGTGALASQLAEGAMVFGLDGAPEGLAYCRGRGLRRLVRGDAAQVPWKSGSMDTVLLLDLLYHQGVSDPRAVLCEARRILAPGGMLVVNVPAYEWLRSSHDVAVHTGRRFTRRGINGLLNEAGFEIERSSYWNTVLFPAIVAVRLLLRFAPDRGSDLQGGTSPLQNRILGAVMAWERRVMSHVSLPFGLSIFVVARTPRSDV